MGHMLIVKKPSCPALLTEMHLQNCPEWDVKNPQTQSPKAFNKVIDDGR